MHVIWRLANGSALLLAIAAARATAQATPRVGLDVGIPVGIAILWHLNDKVDLRPDFNFTHVSIENGGDQTRLGFGASLLFPIKSTTPFTPYVGLRGGYGWYSGSNAPSDWSLAGIFGGRYMIDKRFGVSAETGFEFDHFKPGGGFAASERTLTPWGRVSAIMYF